MEHSKNILVPGIQDSAVITEEGKELNCPDSTTEEFEGVSDPILDRLRLIIRKSVSRQAAEAGFEDFDQANDFDVHDDFENPYAEDSVYMRETFPGEQEDMPFKEKEYAEQRQETDVNDEGIETVRNEVEGAPQPEG